MKIIDIGEVKTIMSNPMSKHNYFAWPTVTRLQNGKIAVAASGFRIAHICPFGKTVISYSENEGESYTLPAPVIDTVLDDRDGGILAYGDKNVIVTSFNNTRKFQRWAIKNFTIKDFESSDMQEYRYEYLNTVTDEEEDLYCGSNFRISTDCGVTFGKLFKSPVSSPHGPTVLNDGSVLWVGTAYTKENRIDAYKINTDGTCEYVGTVPAIIENGEKMLCYEPYAVCLENNKIICHIRVEGTSEVKKFTIYQSESEDGGKTWTVPHKILSDKGGAPSHILKHSSGVLIATYSYREVPCGIKAMFSYDMGETWDIGYDVYIDGVNSDLGYPSSVELKDGSIATVFYSHSKEDKKPAVIMQQKWRFEED